MRFFSRTTLFVLGLGSAWCAGAEAAVAAPAKQPAAAVESGPLIHAELKDPADIARAIRENYTEYEHRIPMRDGVKLFTVVYLPKDPSRTYPMLMIRTPYGVQPYGVDQYPGAQDAR